MVHIGRARNARQIAGRLGIRLRRALAIRLALRQGRGQVRDRPALNHAAPAGDGGGRPQELRRHRRLLGVVRLKVPVGAVQHLPYPVQIGLSAESGLAPAAVRGRARLAGVVLGVGRRHCSARSEQRDSRDAGGQLPIALHPICILSLWIPGQGAETRLSRHLSDGRSDCCPL